MALSKNVQHISGINYYINCIHYYVEQCVKFSFQSIEALG